MALALSILVVLLLSNGVLSLSISPSQNYINARRHPLHPNIERIVDGAGYSMHNTGFSLDLGMQANPPAEGNSIGTVTLEPYENARTQKWGTTFYGLPNQVEVSNGQYAKNFVSIYYPEGSSRDKARLYKFETLSLNHYRILNLETRLCLVAIQRSSEDPISVEFGSCTEGNYTWLLRRTG